MRATKLPQTFCRPQQTRVRKLCKDFFNDEVQSGVARSPAAAVTNLHKCARGGASADEHWCAERELAIAGEGSEDDCDADMDDVPAQQQPVRGGSGATLAAQSKPGRSKPAIVSNQARRACSYVGKGKCLRRRGGATSMWCASVLYASEGSFE